MPGYERCTDDVLSVLAPDLVPKALALDDSHVYVGTEEGVWAVRRNGGERSLVSANPGLTDISVRDGFVYWSSALPNSGLRRTRLSGGPVEELASDTTLSLALTEDSIFASSWAQAPTVVRRYDFDGGNSTTIATLGGQDFLRKLVAIDGALYFMPLQTLGWGDVHRVELATGEDQVIGANYEAMDFAVDRESLYWVEQNWQSGTGADDTSEIHVVSRTGGDAKILVSLNGYAYGIALDDRHLFVSLHELHGHEYTAHLLRISRSGEDACELAASEGLAWKIVLDAGRVFWASSGLPGVMSVAIR